VSRIATMRWGVIALLVCAVLSFAADKKDDAKSHGNVVDSGSFGVFIKGQRVVTETFSVQQENGVSTVKSSVQDAGNSNSLQSSELQMTGSGELISYDWNDKSGSLTVLPKNEFLIEKITAGSSKPAERPFLMPNTSAILDNNFFVHREVLAWRYLATNCHADGGNLKCQQGPVEFGVLVPQDQTSMRVRMELTGKQKIAIRGTERDLLRIELKGESFAWTLWVDGNDQFKLVRVDIPDDNTEVVRD
jgi:hypothetical protein